MKPHKILGLALTLASCIACQPKSPEEHPYHPEFRGRDIDRMTPSSSSPSNPGIDLDYDSLLPEGLPSFGGGDEEYFVTELDNLFDLCEVQEEDSDRCYEYWEGYID